jgi:CheY-like chemotaxis protein
MPTPDFESALIVSSSKVMQDLIGRFLRDRAQSVNSAMSMNEATRMVNALGATDLVVLDADIDDDGGLSLLEDSAEAENLNRPSFVVIIGKANLDLETRACLLGAIGLLTKPVSLPKLSALIRNSIGAFRPAAQRLRARPIGEVVLLDEPMGMAIATWEIENISESGAFLNTVVAYEPDTVLPMEIRLGEACIFVAARVIRSRPSQVPNSVGIGVKFEMNADARTALKSSLMKLAALGRVDKL